MRQSHIRTKMTCLSIDQYYKTIFWLGRTHFSDFTTLIIVIISVKNLAGQSDCGWGSVSMDSRANNDYASESDCCH